MDYEHEAQRLGGLSLSFFAAIALCGSAILLIMGIRLLVKSKNVVKEQQVVVKSERKFDAKSCETFLQNSNSFVHMCEYPKDVGEVIDIEYDSDDCKKVHLSGTTASYGGLCIVAAMVLGSIGVAYMFIRRNPMFTTVAGAKLAWKIS